MFKLDVEPCGIFVDLEDLYLGESSVGIVVDKDEIKCFMNIKIWNKNS